MDTYTILFKPRGSYASELRSDTLFGAVCWALADLRLTDLRVLLSEFNTTPRFAFSSVFPILRKDGAEVRFFPMPLIPQLRAEQVDRLSRELPVARTNAKQAKVDAVTRAKRLMKATFVSEKLFTDIVHGETDVERLWRRFRGSAGDKADDVETVGNALITQGERETISPETRLPIFAQLSDVQRNQIDRVAGATVEGLLFYEQQTFLHSEIAGLWCLARTDVPDWIAAAFRYLADTGIGGRRTSGRGNFDIEIKPGGVIPDAGKDANAFVVLSRYLPAAGEWAAGPSYRLQNVRGKHEAKFPSPPSGAQSSPIYKGMVRLMAEGSVFPLGPHKGIYGRIAQVGTLSDRVVWHSGLALAAFARIGRERKDDHE